LPQRDVGPDADAVRAGAPRDELPADPPRGRPGTQGRRHGYPAHPRGARPPHADVILASHDGDFIPQVDALLDGTRRVAVLCFREFVNSHMAELADRGLEFFDLEGDVNAFNTILPRVRI